MASEHSISQVWFGLLDAERLSRYYRVVATRLQRWHMALTALVALGSTGAVGSLLLGAPLGVAEALAAVVAAAAVWTAYYGHASKAALTEAAGMNCADLALCWRDLWARLDGLDEVAVRHEIESLKRREQAATARVPAHLAADGRLNERCAKDAYDVLGTVYAVAI